MIKFSKINICLCCENKMQEIINLPQFPVTEFLVDKRSKINKKYFIDQKILFCESCNHFSLKKILDIKFIYSNYDSQSNQSQGAINCLNEFYKFFKKDKIDEKKCNFIDIGGNDSYLLSLFNSKNKFNVDPNGSGNFKNTQIIKEYFENIDFNQFKSQNQNNFFLSHTIEHLEKPDQIIKNISLNMKKKDFLYLQFPCLEELVLNLRYDQLCHQHLNYFSLNSICKLLKKNNLYVHRYEYDPEHFGTLRVKCGKINKNIKIDIRKITRRKIILGYKHFINYYKIINNIYQKMFENGQGFGAGILVPVLNYYLPLINNLKYIFDDNKFKTEKKFITLNPIIKNSNQINKLKPIIITSVSSRLATRNIIKLLHRLNFKNIIIPSLSL